MRSVLAIAKALVAVFLIAAPVAAAAGPRLDPSFGSDGTSLLPLPERPWGGGAYDIARDPAGRLLLAGFISPRDGDDRIGPLSLIARVLPSGGFDNSFGEGGISAVGIGSGATGVAVQPDGKPVVVGYLNSGHSADINRRYSATAARLNADGSQDHSFDRGEFGELAGSVARDVAIQPNGRVVVVSLDASFIDYRGFVAGFKPNGEKDRDFGTRGLTTIFARGADHPQTDLNDVVVQPDGKLVVTGEIEGRILVARLLANGRPDPSFGDDNGQVAVRFTPPSCQYCSGAHAVRLQSDGRIVVLAHENGRQERTIVLTRFLPDGRLDRSFGPARRGFVRGPRGYALGLAIERDDGIVVAGRSGKGADGHFTVLGYLADGEPDPGFGTAGALVERFGKRSEATSVLVEPNGRIVVAGHSFDPSNPEAPLSLVLQRFLP